MSRPMVVCPACSAVLHHDEDQKPEARLSHHRAVGACRPHVDKSRKPKPVDLAEPKRNIKSSLTGGWDL